MTNVEFIAWVIGIIPAYLFFRKTTKLNSEWNLSDRYFGLFVAASSWFGLIACFIVTIMEGNFKNDKPVSW